MITCLNEGKQKEKHFVERAKRAFKALSGMLEEIQWYGLFQQLLYVIAKCLNPDPLHRPSLHKLRSLALFGGATDDANLAKTVIEARTYISPYSSPERFVVEALVAPMERMLGRLFQV